MAAATLDPLKDAIHREYSALPEGDTLIERLLTKFENVYDKPPRDELSKILGREFDNDDDIREILFKPAPHHGRCYSRLLNSEDFPSARTLALGLLFLLQR